MKKIYLFSFVSVLALMLTFGTAMQVFAAFAMEPVKVRVQPSGSDISSAYGLSGESRTYFGNVEGGTGNYDCMWEFSDGGSTTWANVTDPRYISTTHTFAGSGLKWARLTVRDTDNGLGEDSAIIEVQTLSVDTTNRQKNSAVDRGLRKLYLQEQTGADGSYWGSYRVAETSMALIAFENHRHNLEALDDDIYKKSVQEGLRWLFNHAYEVELSVQPCIGDPEGVPGNQDYDDLDNDNDGYGITFNMYGSGGDWSEGYEVPLAVLAIVNSCEKATAQTLTASSTSSTFVDSMTYWDIIVDAKDFLAYAQTDCGPGGGEGDGQWDECWSEYGYFEYWMGGEMGDDCEYVDFYVEYGNVTDCDTAFFKIDYGDGTTDEGMDWCEDNYAEFWANHSYDPFSGPYIATAYFSQDTGSTWTEICSLEIECAATGECGINGWRYVRNDTSIDNSVSQWPALALDEAKDRWDINVNPQVIVEFDGWLAYSQNANGGFGYTGGGDWDWLNFAKTGAGLAMLKWAGYTSSDTNVQDALSFLDSHWSDTGQGGNLESGDYYGMYAFYKGMKYLGESTLGARNWEDDYTLFLIGDQETDGSWTNSISLSLPSPDMSTGAALAMLAPAVAGLPPVADAGGPYSDVNAGQNVLLDGSGSDHQDPTKNIVLYEWDFDASDGLWWDTKPSPDSGEGDTGMTVDTSYLDTGEEETYTVTLRVTDDSDPVQRDDDTDTVTVTTGNVPPEAKTNGPWAGLPGDTIIFDGTGSYDPNECTTSGDPSCLGDSIVSYEWDIDGDGLFNEINGDDGTPVTPGDYSIVEKVYPAPISQSVTLRVTDSYGLFDLTSPQVNIVSIALVYGTDYNTCFRERISRYEYRLGIEVLFENMGTGTAENVIVTLTNTPTNLTILQDTAILGNMNPGDWVLTGCDPGAMSADIELLFDRRIPPTGEWRWKAEFDFNGNHYIIDNLPPLAP